MHERVEEEVEIMALLLDAEYGYSTNIASNENALNAAEIAYDAQVYKKYMNLSAF